MRVKSKEYQTFFALMKIHMRSIFGFKYKKLRGNTMKEINRLKIMFWNLVYAFIFVGVVACSTMTIKQYPEPPNSLFENAKTIEGVTAVAQPLLNQEDLKNYFGVNLLEKGILPIYLVVKNDNPHDSFILTTESVQIQLEGNKNSIEDPAREKQEAGEAIGLAGAILVSPLLLSVAIQQLSSASIIEENFESKKFRTKTIDPGQQVSGFLYFRWDDLKIAEKVRICFQLVDPLADKSFPFCLKIILRR